ncbi:MAG UNVERIFIED_CONTAM: hypothetical protein LVT10_23085 [Anaerolineae bacterium]|jgi:ABC-type sugar transport system ATPase subunit
MMVGRTIDNLFPKMASTIGKTVLEVRQLNYGKTTRNVSFKVRAGKSWGWRAWLALDEARPRR